MNKFYTDVLSEQVYLALCRKGFEYDESDPLFGINSPTYADALDWLLNNDIEINVFREYDKKWTVTSECKGEFDVHADDINEETFGEALDKAILLAVEFIKPCES